ncbi:MAG: hypothetical protein ACD_25C00154G0002 [uncultured bacterium]|nr:MAG: hypothetical protein ACD_25C00154G0002 [uncultured bacterium]
MVRYSLNVSSGKLSINLAFHELNNLSGTRIIESDTIGG